MGRMIEEIEMYKRLRPKVDNETLDEIMLDVPTVEAIPKDEYENRLKSDMVAMLTEIQLEIEENSYSENVYGDEYGIDKVISTEGIYQIIQQKIDKYKAESEVSE